MRTIKLFDHIYCSRLILWDNSCASMPEQPAYSHSIKIEDTAKGIRLSVHVYANSTGEAIEQVFQTYLKVPPRQLQFI